MKSIAAALVASTLAVLAWLAEYHDLPDADEWNLMAALALLLFLVVLVCSHSDSTRNITVTRKDRTP